MSHPAHCWCPECLRAVARPKRLHLGEQLCGGMGGAKTAPSTRMIWDHFYGLRAIADDRERLIDEARD